MIIDLINYTFYNSGAEADILFKLQENGITVPHFFCVTEDFTLEEIETYLSNHFQDVNKFMIRVSASVKSENTEKFPSISFDLPYVTSVKKHELYRSMRKILNIAHNLIAESESFYDISCEELKLFILIHERVSYDAFGIMLMANPNGILNETLITLGYGEDSCFEKRNEPIVQCRYNESDEILFYNADKNAPKVSNNVLKLALQASAVLKSLSKNYFEVKFAVDTEKEKIYVLKLQNNISIISKNSNIILRNSGICCFYPTALTPLSANFIQLMYKNIADSILKKVYFKDENIPDYIKKDLDYYVTYINGYLYSYTEQKDISQYGFFSFIFSKQDNIKNISNGLFSKLRDYNVFQKSKFNLKKIIFENNKKIPDEIKKFTDFCNKFKEKNFNDMPYSTVEQIYCDIAEKVKLYCELSILNDVLTFIQLSKLKHFLYTHYSSDWKNAVTQYIFGGNGIDHLIPIPKQLVTKISKIKLAEKNHRLLRQQYEQLLFISQRVKKMLALYLYDINLIEEEEDINFLTIKELYSLYDDNKPDFSLLVKKRKEKFKRDKMFPKHMELIFNEKIVEDVPDSIDGIMFPTGSGILCGIPYFPGFVKGEVICYNDNIQIEELENKIVVINQINEELLLCNVRGIIMESAMLPENFKERDKLSKIPMIAGVSNAYTILSDIKYAKLNGWTGELKVFRI
ncbi:MAG: hypothetical protein IJZ64_05850 [Ruminococcus sp.]|nr:hypothetical protein [Ruminococcus sp.]